MMMFILQSVALGSLRLGTGNLACINILPVTVYTAAHARQTLFK